MQQPSALVRPLGATVKKIKKQEKQFGEREGDRIGEQQEKQLLLEGLALYNSVKSTAQNFAVGNFYIRATLFFPLRSQSPGHTEQKVLFSGNSLINQLYISHPQKLYYMPNG